jgi:polysaccharide pyruvyl transferase CsaB
MKALLMGYYGARNLGDEMMLVCLREWLERQHVEITVVSERPEQVRLRPGLNAVENWPLLGEWSWRAAWLKGGAFSLLRALASHDALIVGGGDLVRDDLGWRSYFFTMEKVIAALLLRKRVYFVNVGIGRPRTVYGRNLLRWALPRAEQIIVRDRRSLEVCRECGAGERAVLAPDIVSTLPSILALTGASTGGRGPAAHPYVVVALRAEADVFGLCRIDEKRIQNIAAALDAMVERDNVEMVFVPFQAAEIDDGALHRRVASAMHHFDRAIVRPWTDELSEVYGVFSEARGVVAMRLHAAVLAVACERPCVVLPYDHKVREFAELIDLDVVDPADLDDRRRAVAALGSVAHVPPRTFQSAADDDSTNFDWREIWNSLALRHSTASDGDVDMKAMPTPLPPVLRQFNRARARFVNDRLTKETTP